MSPKQTGIIGIAAVALFFINLLIFGLLHPDFNFLTDYISKLGYKGTALALWWNVLGFGLTGILLSTFGLFYGHLVKDKLAGALLSLFGLGFMFTAIPFDLANETAGVSKAHILAITLGLAAWLFGLARLGYNKSLSARVRKSANIAAGILGVFMIGSMLELWSQPIAQRLVFAVVFGWTLVSALALLSNDNK